MHFMHKQSLKWCISCKACSETPSEGILWVLLDTFTCRPTEVRQRGDGSHTNRTWSRQNHPGRSNKMGWYSWSGPCLPNADLLNTHLADAGAPSITSSSLQHCCDNLHQCYQCCSCCIFDSWWRFSKTCQDPGGWQHRRGWCSMQGGGPQFMEWLIKTTRAAETQYCIRCPEMLVFKRLWEPDDIQHDIWATCFTTQRHARAAAISTENKI